MNTKIKARVLESVGRPVGVLPLDPRPKQNRRLPRKAINEHNSTTNIKLGELKTGRFTRSNSVGNSDSVKVTSATSTRSAGSTRSRSGSSSRTKPKVTPPKASSSRNPRTGSTVSDVSYYGSDSDNEGQDVKFFNMPSARSRPSTSLDGPVEKRLLNPDYILSCSQESDYNNVYEIIQHGEEITDISNLQQFKKVKILDLSCNFIEKIQNLNDNLDIRELKLYDNRIKVIENLDHLKELSCLQLQHNKIRAIGKGLSQLKKIKTLRLDSNLLLKLETSDFISCVQLTSLDLSFNMLDNLSALSYLPNLEELSASGNRLRKVNELSRCKGLVELDLSNNRLTDLSGFTNLTHLQILRLSNNQITTLNMSGKLKSLEELDVSANKIKELSPLLTAVPNLQILNISDNNISIWDQVLSLSKLGDLVELFISGNPFSEENGEKPGYFTELQSVIPQLEILDGALVKKLIGKATAPLMRPMSASTVVSVRQMDNQLKAVNQELAELQTSISKRFESLRSTCSSLPAEAPPSSARSIPVPSPSEEPEFRPCSSSRSRIMMAQQYAASQNFT
ncbi:hypothetical protein LOTGIDRAFT_230176 [Lottia gigantea]|uniref:Protein phosphatase 1 regulatory subunit 7 n=1 Tax=Lottia gigantea TaxID=225164 RepID=V4BDP1_LOTGI|nr:hypothetical protein LOTGIDRAFT_230176 [Lottia gigantea]ESP03837.1 hypothetical protein LOTGIDRAFT_230176 [Lottia gigantea]